MQVKCGTGSHVCCPAQIYSVACYLWSAYASTALFSDIHLLKQTVAHNRLLPRAVGVITYMVQAQPWRIREDCDFAKCSPDPGAIDDSNRISVGTAHLTLAAQYCSIEFAGCFLPLCDIHQISQRTLTSVFKGQQCDRAFCQHEHMM